MLYNQQRIIVKKEKNFFRNCPSCDKQMGYVYARTRDRAVLLGRKCASCSQKGKTLSAEHKVKIGASGRGRKHTDEAKAKISAGNKGKTLSPETRAKISAAKKGKKLSPELKAKILKNNILYAKKKKDAWTEMWGDKYIFSRNHCTNWANKVRARDNNTCQKCAKVATGHFMHAHHIVPKEYFMARALDIDNGCTLCTSCHKQVHAEHNTYVLKGVKFSATDFINHYHEWKPNGPIKE